MVEILWKEPPSTSPRGVEYQAIIDQLKDNPGKWALVLQGWKTSAAPTAFRQASCETAVRRTADKKTFDVYARYPASAAQRAAGQAAAERKAEVEKAISTGTALKPPTFATPKPKEPVTAGGGEVTDSGLQKFINDRHARGVRPEGP